MDSSPTALEVLTLAPARLLDTVALEWAAADATDGNVYAATGREIVLLRNEGEEAVGVTLVSTADPLGRTADLEDTVAAGTTVALMPGIAGWRQDDGSIQIEADSDDLVIAVLRLPTS